MDRRVAGHDLLLVTCPGVGVGDYVLNRQEGGLWRVVTLHPDDRVTVRPASDREIREHLDQAAESIRWFVPDAEAT